MSTSGMVIEGFGLAFPSGSANSALILADTRQRCRSHDLESMVGTRGEKSSHRCIQTRSKLFRGDSPIVFFYGEFIAYTLCAVREDRAGEMNVVLNSPASIL